jgi:purine-binding chemotaxis protein CheW
VTPEPGKSDRRAGNGSKQLCTFFLGRLVFGVDVMQVQEVIRYQPMTRVPLSSPVVGGLINLRGQIVTAIDMRRRIGLPPRPADQLPMNVVVRSDDEAFSLLVDEIGDVVDVDEDSFEQPPATMAAASRELIRGVYKLKRRLLLLLDTERATRVASHDNSRAAGELGR